MSVEADAFIMALGELLKEYDLTLKCDNSSSNYIWWGKRADHPMFGLSHSSLLEPGEIEASITAFRPNNKLRHRLAGLMRRFDAVITCTHDPSGFHSPLITVNVSTDVVPFGRRSHIKHSTITRYFNGVPP